MNDDFDDLPAGQQNERVSKALHLRTADAHKDKALSLTSKDKAAAYEHLYAAHYHLSVATNPHGFTSTGRQKVGGCW